MEWNVTHNGSQEIQGLEINPDGPRPDLTEQVLAASKEIRKGKHGHETMTLRVTTSALEGAGGSAPFYQPIGKVIFVHTHQDGSLKKVNLFSYICVGEESRVGGPNPKYICHTFKCRNEDEASQLSFAMSRTMVGNGRKSKPDGNLEDLAADDLEQAVKMWNASALRMFHFSVGKDQTVGGVIKFFCQIDKNLKSVTKLVRISNLVKGDELIKLLGEKFNIGDIDTSEYAVFAHMDTGEQHMLDDDGSPIAISLSWDDPSEGSFWLRKLPPGLVRVATRSKNSLDGPALQEAKQAIAAEAAAAAAAAAAPAPAKNEEAQPQKDSVADTSNSSDHDNTLVGDEGDRTQDSGLGPLLPYHQDDEDLLLSVMIARQSGTGLGFKLTPAYLLQMCVAYCALHRGEEALTSLLQKVSTQIGTAVADNPKNPEMALFWASNAMKLSTTLKKDPRTSTVFQQTIEADLEATVDTALKSICNCSMNGDVPEVLSQSEWSTVPQLRAVIQAYYEGLDANMSYENLQEVVQRITAAMPSPLHKQPESRSASTDPEATPGQRQAGLVLQDAVNLQASSMTDAETDDVPFTSTPTNGKLNTPTDASILGASAIPHEETTVASADRRGLRQPEPLPDEWEELVDQETKHRFFANHLTRQTSWTDPRDTLRTVQLTKGNTGLGLGISGAKRTWDDRLVLGIFVSSLVPDSAAALEGTLREGDEILEVNGHSLIGVSREGAIEFLKQVKFGDTVTLLVSQEPEYMRKPQLRHTAL